MKPILISKQTARRFVLGRQGLWPGRRWRGKSGTAAALRACEAVQEDPLVVVARSHDIVLHSRVLDYKPEYLTQVMYEERGFFDYGGGLFIYPMSELPYWRLHMQRRSLDKRMEDFVLTHPDLFEQVRAELRRRGPLGNRAVQGQRAGSWNYRGRKDTSLALFDMWLSGELMIHHREGFDRVYDFRANVAPQAVDHAAPQREAEDFLARKAVAQLGLMGASRWKTAIESYIHRKIDRGEMKQWMEAWLEQELIAPVQVAGWREKYLVLAQDIPSLELLEAGRLPKGWKPLGPSTSEEVTFLAPLDIVSARSRADKLFDFEYLWEVYKPKPQRRWGYYTLPILYGDDLVARLDPKLERTSRTLQIKGFWVESDAPVREPEFAQALAGGLARFAWFLGAKRIDTAALRPAPLRARVRAALKQPPAR